ncbi:MAG: prepilin-type N-terminal cleavage/methylation domain-containing protein [Deltaproteobacteria bacterium]|nr:prepilin-type N-terminal cleavage/methylation domain-containing protein [Deltaproteobacteria bacterium]
MNKDCARKALYNPGGFTLIELSVVLFLIGLIVSLVLPQIRDAALSDTLKNTAMVLTSTVNEIRHQAVKDNRECFLKFNFETKRFWADLAWITDEERNIAEALSFSLPSDVEVTDICFKDGKIYTSEEVSISFSREGYITPAVIHLSSRDGRRLSFILRPFLGDAGVVEEYIEVDDAEM